MTNEPMTMAVVNRTEKMKPRLRPRSMHLATRDEPDRSEAPHVVGPATLGRAAWLCGCLGASATTSMKSRRASAAGRRSGAPPPPTGGRQQLVERDGLVHDQLDPAVRTFDDLDLRREPASQCAIGAVDLDLEVAAAGRRAQLADRTLSDDAAAGDDHDVLADVLDEVELVAAEDDPDAGIRALAKDLGHGRHAQRVEPREGLVEDQQLRLVDQCGRELDALLVAVREVLQLAPGPVGEAETFQPAVRGGVGQPAR